MNDILHGLTTAEAYDPSKHGEIRKSGAGRQESSTTRAVRDLLKRTGFETPTMVRIPYRSSDGKKLAGTFRRLATDLGIRVSLSETDNGLTVFTLHQREDSSTPAETTTSEPAKTSGQKTSK